MSPASPRSIRRKTVAAPAGLIAASVAVALLWWGASSLRHLLLQSNAFDLGIYDQVAWLISQGLEARSTLLGLHHMGNHGAWAFYPMGILYRIQPSVQWLFLLQSGCLAFTALPLWQVARRRGLSARLCWLVCLAWWLQPVVFRTNLYDFHPETLAMPLLAGLFVQNAANRWIAWMLLLVLVMGFRDGLCLIVIGLAFCEALRRRWRWSLGALVLGVGWLLFLSRVLYPLLNEGRGPAALQRFGALGDSIETILWTLLSQPWKIASIVDLGEVLTYLLLLALPLAWTWRRRSLPTLAACLPLVMVNALSDNAAQRNLGFHYNLPIAVLLCIAAIEGLAADDRLREWVSRHLSLSLLWLVSVWVILVDLGDVARDFSERAPMLAAARQVIADVRPQDRVLVPTYIAPQLSQRRVILRPLGEFNSSLLRDLDLVVINSEDPGWSTTDHWNRDALAAMEAKAWRCQSYPDGFIACRP